MRQVSLVAFGLVAAIALAGPRIALARETPADEYRRSLAALEELSQDLDASSQALRGRFGPEEAAANPPESGVGQPEETPPHGQAAAAKKAQAVLTNRSSEVMGFASQPERFDGDLGGRADLPSSDPAVPAAPWTAPAGTPPEDQALVGTVRGLRLGAVPPPKGDKLPVPVDIPPGFAAKYPDFTQSLVNRTGPTPLESLNARLEKAKVAHLAAGEEQLRRIKQDRIDDPAWCSTNRESCRDLRLEQQSGRVSPREARALDREVRRRLQGDEGSEFRADLDAAKAESLRTMEKHTGPVKLAGTALGVVVPPLGTLLGTVALGQSAAAAVQTCVDGKWNDCTKGAQGVAGDVLCKRFSGGKGDLCGLAASGAMGVREFLFGDGGEREIGQLAKDAADKAARHAACGRLVGVKRLACETSITAARVGGETAESGELNAKGAIKVGKGVVQTIAAARTPPPQ